jgi:hypothetical protein
VIHIAMVQTDYNSHKLFKSYYLAKFINPNELAIKVLTDQQHAYMQRCSWAPGYTGHGLGHEKYSRPLL